MSKDGITLSEKHGVNPSLTLCFFCGEAKGIALMGHIGDRRKHEDIEAPKEIVMDYEPCDKCKENMKLGVTLIEVTTTQPEDHRPSMKAQGDLDVYPTGKWCVITAEACNRAFNQDLKEGQILLVETKVMNQVLGDK